LAPQPPASLGSVERHGVDTPWFEREFRIPYETIEPLIRDEIRQTADIFKSDTVGRPTIFCPDVDWSVAVKSKFEFTQKGQPVITALAIHNRTALTLDLMRRCDFRRNLLLNFTPMRCGIGPLGHNAETISSQTFQSLFYKFTLLGCHPRVVEPYSRHLVHMRSYG
jgi:hypothetical protein